MTLTLALFGGMALALLLGGGALAGNARAGTAGNGKAPSTATDATSTSGQGGSSQGGSSQGGSSQGGSSQGGSSQGGSSTGASSQGGSSTGGDAQGGSDTTSSTDPTTTSTDATTTSTDTTTTATDTPTTSEAGGSPPSSTGAGQRGNAGGASEAAGSNGSPSPAHPHPGRKANKTLPPLSAPVAGKSVALHPAHGEVEITLPGSATAIPLSRAASVPVGAVIDTTHGQVTLTSVVSASGAVKTGTFNGGSFIVSQTAGAHPLTRLLLRGGSFAVCRTAAAADSGPFASPLALTFARLWTSQRVIRQLWGSDHGGRFETVGRSAAATVRGTVWRIQDRCDGTLVTVRRGAVVVHLKASGRNVLVRAGHSFLARAAA